MKASDLYDGVVIRPYKSWSDVKLSSEMTKVKTAMTNNALFPTPVPSMEVFGAALDNYVSQLAKAGTRDANAIAAKNARRSDLIALCVQLGYSVSNIANGDVEALVSTGLPLKKKRQNVVLNAPSNLRITNGKNPGELDVKVDGVKAAVSFGFEYTMDPITDQSVWVKTICTTSRCTIKNLESGKKYWFRTFVVGSKGQQVMGDTLLSPFVQ